MSIYWINFNDNLTLNTCKWAFGMNTAAVLGGCHSWSRFTEEETKAPEGTMSLVEIKLVMRGRASSDSGIWL